MSLLIFVVLRAHFWWIYFFPISCFSSSAFWWLSVSFECLSIFVNLWSLFWDLKIFPRAFGGVWYVFDFLSAVAWIWMAGVAANFSQKHWWEGLKSRKTNKNHAKLDIYILYSTFLNFAQIQPALVSQVSKADGGRWPIGLMPTLVRVWERLRKPVVVG